MVVELEINGSSSQVARYIANAPSPCRLRLAPSAGVDVNVTLNSRPAQAGGGEALFYASRGLPPTESLALTLPADGSWVSFEIGGKFGVPSSSDQDCLLVVNGLAAEITLPLMVRVRKNANNLTSAERDRFWKLCSSSIRLERVSTKTFGMFMLGPPIWKSMEVRSSCPGIGHFC
jgi:tyrosinase